MGCKSEPPICKSQLFFRAFDLQIAGSDLHVICIDLQGANQMEIMRILEDPSESQRIPTNPSESKRILANPS